MQPFMHITSILTTSYFALATGLSAVDLSRQNLP